MRTKFDVGSKVYYLNLGSGDVEIGQVFMISIIENNEILYSLGKDLVLPESAIFSCELQCKNFYSEKLK